MNAPDSAARAIVDPVAIRTTLSRDAIERVAGYGAPPAGLLDAVAYVLAVARRRSALGELRAAAERRLRAAKGDAEEALRRLGRAVYDERHRLDAPALAEAIDAVDAASAEVVDAGARAASVLASVASDEARADAEIASARAQVDPLRDQETKLAAQREVAEHDLRRADARRKRVDIELRNLRASFEAQPSLGAPGTEGASKLGMLEADLAARDAEVRLLEGRVADRTADLGRVRRELAAAVARVAAAEEARRKIADQARLTAATQASETGAAESVQDAALVALGREALTRGVGRGMPAFDPAAAAERAWGERAREVALYDAAMDGFDRDGFRKGLGILAGSVAIIVLAIVVAVVG